MFKRIRWLVVGALLGIYVYRRAGRSVREAVPKAVVGDSVGRVKSGAREALGTLREALREGAEAMREEEARLRREVLGA